MRQQLRRFIPFCVVGGIGFAVDVGILALLVRGFEIDPLIARLASFPCAMTVTWYLNRRVTFSHAVSNKPGEEWLRYAIVSMTGNLVNFIVYASCMRLSQLMFTYPELALAVASMVAMAFNYIGFSRYAFRNKVDI